MSGGGREVVVVVVFLYHRFGQYRFVLKVRQYRNAGILYGITKNARARTLVATNSEESERTIE